MIPRGSGIGRRHAAAGIRRYVQPQAIVTSYGARGGYDGILGLMTSSRRAKALLAATRAWRHVPGIR